MLAMAGPAAHATTTTSPPAEAFPELVLADVQADEDADDQEETSADGPALGNTRSFGDTSFGPRYAIDAVEVRGNTKTSTELILAEVGLRAGDVVTASDPRVETARVRLLSLGYFLDVRLSLQRGATRGRAILIVDVEERGTVILNAIHLGSSRATTFWGGLELSENNLLGRGISVGGGVVGSTVPDVRGADAGFGARLRASAPPLAGTGLSIGASGLYSAGSEFFRVTGPEHSANSADFVALRTQRLGAVLGFARPIARNLRAYVDFRGEGISAELPTERARQVAEPGRNTTAPIEFDVAEGFSRLGSLTATLDYDTRSDPLVPRAGAHAVLSAEAAPAALGSSYEFLKLLLQVSLHRRAVGSHVVALHLVGGAIFGNAPYFDQFFVGDLNPLLPPRALGLNFSTQPSRNLLGTSIASHRYDNFAGRVLVDYSIPIWRRRRLIYSGNAFVAVGLFGMASRGRFRDETRSGLAALPLDLTADLGVRLDTSIGIFTVSFANALGRIPF